MTEQTENNSIDEIALSQETKLPLKIGYFRDHIIK